MFNCQRDLLFLVAVLLQGQAAVAAEPQPLTFPPRLPEGQDVARFSSPQLLVASPTLQAGVAVAKTPPRIDFLYYPGQDYPGNPWSVWGDGVADGGKYYSAIGDHLAPEGSAFVYGYDPQRRTLRTLVDVRALLDLPPGHYSPGKIHSRIDLGRDGWLYFATHRGSTRVTTDRYHYQGDWILRHHPVSGKTEIVAHGPVAKHCIPTSVLDPERLIFYGGTAAGSPDDKTIMFFAYDIPAGKLRHAAPEGPYRYMIFARSTGRVYYVNRDGGTLMRYDPANDQPPRPIGGTLGLRAATKETPDGYVYTVSTRGDATVWRFATKTEEIEQLGSAAVASQTYVTSIDADPSGRFLYYIPGAHGGSQQDGSPVVQLDVRTGLKKVIAFLHPFLQEQLGYVPLGTFSSAVDPSGDKLYITWNGNRGGPDRRGRYPFDTCALTVIHIPPSEREP